MEPEQSPEQAVEQSAEQPQTGGADCDAQQMRKRRSGAVSPIPEEPLEPETRHAKRGRLDSVGRAPRGRGMLGMLNSTLTAFKRESEASSSAASKRLQVEAKASAKLADSERRMTQIRQQEQLAWQARDLAQQIAATEAQRKTMRALKRRMASFLWTTQPTPARSISANTTAGVFASNIPVTMAPVPHHRRSKLDSYPIYFLPGKTLPEQEDLLNQQEDAVDDEIDRLDDAWQHHKQTLLADLERVKASIRDSQSRT